VQAYVKNLFLKTYFKDIKRKKHVIDIDELNISSVYEITREPSEINTAFITLELLSKKHEKNRYNVKIYNEVKEQAAKISKKSNILLNNLSNKDIIKSSNLTAYGRKNKDIKEYFINMDEKEVADIYKYSIKNNTQILKKIINFVNKDALKNPKYICFFAIDINKAAAVSKFINEIKRSPNFFLLFKGLENSKNTFMVEQDIKKIQENGHQVILVVKMPDEKDLSLFKKLKPKYIAVSQ